MFALYRAFKSTRKIFTKNLYLRFSQKNSKEDRSCVYVPTEESFQPIWLTLATNLNLADDFFSNLFLFLNFYLFYVVDDFFSIIFPIEIFLT